MNYVLIGYIEAQALTQAQRIFLRLGGQITQISDLIITNDIPLYTKCYMHSLNKLLKRI